VLFYFDFGRAPAIVLLPLWLANEAYQLVFVRGHVNYLAHIGGLIAGAALAAGYRYRHADAITKYHSRAQQQEQAQTHYVQDMRQARKHVGDLDFERALAIYEKWLRKRPQERELMVQSYRIARHQPGSDAYHRAAARILALNEKDAGTSELVHETFTEYFRNAKPAVRLAPAQWLALATRFSDDGHLQDAERLVIALARQDPPPPELPALLLRHSVAWKRSGQEDKAMQWLTTLRERFPESDAARTGIAY